MQKVAIKVFAYERASGEENDCSTLSIDCIKFF